MKVLLSTLTLVTLFASGAFAEIKSNPTLAEAQAFADSVKDKPRCDTSVSKFSPNYVVYVSTPLCRIESTSIQARERFDTLTLTEESLADYRPGMLSVSSFPKVSPTGQDIWHAAEVIVLRGKDGTIIKPVETVNLEPMSFSNKLGYEGTFPAIAVYFKLEDVAKVQDKKGEFEIVTRVPSWKGELEFKVKEKQIKKLF